MSVECEMVGNIIISMKCEENIFMVSLYRIEVI